MTGSDRAGAASTIFFHPRSHVRVVPHADDLTFAATETELKRMRSKMFEWYGVKWRGILGSGRHDVRERKILEVKLRWTDQGLE